VDHHLEKLSDDHDLQAVSRPFRRLPSFAFSKQKSFSRKALSFNPELPVPAHIRSPDIAFPRFRFLAMKRDRSFSLLPSIPFFFLLLHHLGRDKNDEHALSIVPFQYRVALFPVRIAVYF
jgi:hypothetical protein